MILLKKSDIKVELKASSLAAQSHQQLWSSPLKQICRYSKQKIFFYLSVTHVSSPNFSTTIDLRQVLMNPYCRRQRHLMYNGAVA